MSGGRHIVTLPRLPYGFDDGVTFSADRRYHYRLWRSIVWAWGGVSTRVVHMVRERELVVRAMARRHKPTSCPTGTIGLTAGGDPRHPSRLAYAAAGEPDA